MVSETSSAEVYEQIFAGIRDSRDLAQAIARGVIRFVNVMGDRHMQLPGSGEEAAPPIAVAPPPAPSGLAHDPANGKILWHSGLMAAPSNGMTTYMLDGKQHLLVGAGDSLYSFTINKPVK